MRTETFEVNIYKFNELDYDAKERAKERILYSFHDDDWFTDLVNEDIKSLYPNIGKFTIEYQLQYCQGDFFRINSEDMPQGEKEKLESEFMKFGYEFLYGISDEECEELCDINEIEFDYRGEIYSKETYM